MASSSGLHWAFYRHENEGDFVRQFLLLAGDSTAVGQDRTESRYTSISNFWKGYKPTVADDDDDYVVGDVVVRRKEAGAGRRKYE